MTGRIRSATDGRRINARLVATAQIALLDPNGRNLLSFDLSERVQTKYELRRSHTCAYRRQIARASKASRERH